MIYRIIVDGLLSEFANGEGVLLNITQKRYHNFNATGVFIWTVLEKGPTDEADVVAALKTKYGLDSEHAQSTAHRFITELGSLGLVESSSG